MAKKICIIDGHPDPEPLHLIHALCDAYQAGAEEAGHSVTRVNISALTIDLLERSSDFDDPPQEPVLTERQKIADAQHVLIAFPLWLGGMPAKLRAFFEQAARGDFFIARGDDDSDWPEQLMKGKSARVLVSMGMPGLIYRFAMDSAGLKALERGILGLSGFQPLRHTIIGGAGELTEEGFHKWVEKIEALGRDAS